MTIVTSHRKTKHFVGCFLIFFTAYCVKMPYSLASELNQTQQIKAYAMKATIRVEVNEATVVAHTQFHNISDQPIWIRNGIFGIFREESAKIRNGSADEFDIRTRDGIHLGFNGFIFNFVVPPTKEKNFTPIMPGEIVTASKIIGPIPSGSLKGLYIYKFLPGAHEYEISARYMIFDEKENNIKILKTEFTTFSLTMPNVNLGN